MLRVCSSSWAMVASSGTVGVANWRQTVAPHLSQVSALGTCVSKFF